MQRYENKISRKIRKTDSINLNQYCNHTLVNILTIGMRSIAIVTLIIIAKILKNNNNNNGNNSTENTKR